MALKNNTWKLNQWYDQSVAGNAGYAGLNQLWTLGGANARGYLGQNNTTYYSSPVQIPGSTWSQAEGTFYASSGVKTDGTLWAWGYNIYGTLGQNSETQYSSPVQIAGTTWSQISVGQVNMMAVKTDGTLWGWGSNGRGSLGYNGNHDSHRSSPTQVPGTTWSKVDTAFSRAFGIKTDGTLWSWGYNNYGYLGVNNNTQRSSPVQVPGTTWKDVNDGTYHVVATKTDGTLWTWGYQDNGELGQNIGGSGGWRSSPVQIPGTDWAHAVAGQQYSLATKTDGTLWAWGRNEQGQLGHNNNTAYSSPVQIPGTDWSTETDHMEVDGNGKRTYLIKTNGTLWVIGDGSNGYLGLNNTTKYSSPVQVGSGTSWNKLGSSDQGTLASILQ